MGSPSVLQQCPHCLGQNTLSNVEGAIEAAYDVYDQVSNTNEHGLPHSRPPRLREIISEDDDQGVES